MIPKKKLVFIDKRRTVNHKEMMVKSLFKIDKQKAKTIKMKDIDLWSMDMSRQETQEELSSLNHSPRKVFSRPISPRKTIALSEVYMATDIDGRTTDMYEHYSPPHWPELWRKLIQSISRNVMPSPSFYEESKTTDFHDSSLVTQPKPLAKTTRGSILKNPCNNSSFIKKKEQQKLKLEAGLVEFKAFNFTKTK